MSEHRDRYLLRFLAALKLGFAGSGLATLEDPRLRKQVQMIDEVLAFMLAQREELPAIEAATLRSLIEAADDAEALLKTRGLRGDAAGALRAMAGVAPAPVLAEILKPASELQLQLCAIDDETARTLRRRLVEIETRASRDLSAAFEARLEPPAAATDSSGAANTRALDESRFNAFLARAFPAEKKLRLASCNYLAGGHSKYTAKLRLDGAKTVPSALILRGDGSGKYGGKSVVEEYRLLDVLHRHGVSVPRPLALDESGTVFGTPMMLVEEMPGAVVGHMFDLPAPSASVCRDVARQLARVHCIPVAELGDQVDGAERSNREHASQWLAESYTNFKALNRASPVFETAFQWLQRNIALNDGPRTLVHGDCGLNNLMIHEDRVSTLLDWEFAYVGNPAYDLGYFFFQAEHLSSWEDFMDAYREAGGPVPDARSLDYHILFATTRLGVMVLQTEAAFATGLQRNLGGAVASTCYHDVSLMRISRILERVL